MRSLLERVRHWLFKPRLSSSSELETPSFPSVEVDEEIRSVRHGTVTVVNNQLIVSDPDDEGSFATIVIPDDPRLTDRNVSGRSLFMKISISRYRWPRVCHRSSFLQK